MQETLRLLREKNKLSQASVAEYLGISRQMYMKYEAGENEPSVSAIVLLSKLYQVSYDILIDNKLEKKIKTPGQKDYFVSSPTPVYSATVTKTAIKSTYDILYMRKLELLSPEQKAIVGNLIDSLSELNKTEKKRFREPGGLTESIYIADDFDETPDCFKEYM